MSYRNGAFERQLDRTNRHGLRDVLAKVLGREHLQFVSHDEKIAKPAPSRAWTRPEDYAGALALRRSFRRAHRPRERTQPESPRAMLSTIPFLALLLLLGVLSVAIMVIAFPGNQPQRRQAQAERQQGVAERGWFQEAQKEMRR